MMDPNTPDSIALLRIHLQNKSADELIVLLLDLIQQVDEPTRQQFWNRLAPPGLATADLRYPSSEIFLAKLDEFAKAVEQGDYFDEEAQEYYGEDLYRQIMQLHIDNGRKTYATAAYYCALLGEIAAFDGRQAEFNQFYQELRRRMPAIALCKLS